MASVIYGGGVTNIIGSHAGNTFARNKGGAYMKKKTHGTNPRSSSQLKFRTNLGRLAKAYSFTLTDVQRAAWRTFAATNPTVNRLGNTTFLSGQQAFAKFNANVLHVGGTPVATPPASTAVGTVSSFVLFPDATSTSTIKINITAASAGTSDQAFVWLSPPMNPGRAFISSQLRLIPNFVPLSTLTDLTGNYKVLFGSLPLVAGQRIFARVAIVNTDNGVSSAFLGGSAFWT